MYPCKFLALLYRGNAGAVDEFFCFLADDSLHKVAARFIISALQFLHIKKFVISELTVQLEGAAVGAHPGFVLP